MERLLQFLFKYRNFILLITLEGICFWIIVNANSYQGAKFFTSSNRLVAAIAQVSDQVNNYFSLTSQNETLAKENARLRQHILSISDADFAAKVFQDSNQVGIKAKVIDNSLFFRNNYLTLNKGSVHGITPGMGVVGPDGVVGQVLNSSENYSTVISLLHGKTMISAHHKPTRTLCSVTWKGEDPLYADLQYLPRHISIAPGDSVSTSGYNATFPEDQMIGVVTEVQLEEEATFYSVKLKLSTNFYTLTHVYLLTLKGQEEIDSLNFEITQQYE